MPPSSASSVEIANLVVGIVGALGTIIALVVAIILGLHEARRFRAEAEERDAERRAEAEAQERAQAERVSAIAYVQSAYRKRTALIDGRLQEETVHDASAEVVNASALPIYEAKVAVPMGDGFKILAIGFIPGSEKARIGIPVQPSTDLDGTPLQVVFRDAGDRWWSRDTEGGLRRRDVDPLPMPSAEEEVD